MKSIWEAYPATYRQKEATEIIQAVQAGACVSVVGLSGSGKSNLLGFLADRYHDAVDIYYLDANRVGLEKTDAFFKLVLAAFGEKNFQADCLEQTLHVLGKKLDAKPNPIALVIDRYDAFQNQQAQILASQLRYLRDSYKYRLSFVLGTRTPLDHATEIAELCYAHTIYLGSLSLEDAHWTIQAFAERNHLDWHEDIISKIIHFSGSYPSFLRGVCEAVAAGCQLTSAALKKHPAVQQRLVEFHLSQPSDDLLQKCGLSDHPWLEETQPELDLQQLTAQEYRLFSYFQTHTETLCTKDDLIQAVWSEDKIYGQGLRDDSLAQLVRRLREKIETDPSNPQKIQTVIGRGYLYRL